MAFSVVMPALEMAQETGKLIAWRKKEGDRVSKGEPLLEIETDKAVVEVEAPADGILAGITAKEGSDIPVGQTIAWIVAPGEKPPVENESASSAPGARAGPRRLPNLTYKPAAWVRSGIFRGSRARRISPKARRLAKELGSGYCTVRGTGPGRRDSRIGCAGRRRGELSMRAAPASSGGRKLEVPSTLGRLMAERTTQSWTTVPHFFVTREIEASGLNEYRGKIIAEIERSHKIRITHTDLMVALVARVLLKHPRLNSSWTRKEFVFMIT